MSFLLPLGDEEINFIGGSYGSRGLPGICLGRLGASAY